MAKGVFFVVSAPSGAGKSTLIDRIRPMFPDMLYSVSCTTRPRRGNEVDGVHYHFLDKDRFTAMIENHEFLEWKQVHGNMYGSPKEPVMRALAQNRSMILDIDVQGAEEVFAGVPHSVGIFITAPDMRVLEERLRSRGTDSEDTIRIRMANARQELKAVRIFSYRIVNDDLDRAVAELALIIRKESGCNCGGETIRGTSP